MLDLKIIIGSTRPGTGCSDGQSNDLRTRAAAKILLDDLAWWAKALRQARAPAGTLPPAPFRLMAAREGAGR